MTNGARKRCNNAKRNLQNHSANVPFTNVYNRSHKPTPHSRAHDVLFGSGTTLVCPFYQMTFTVDTVFINLNQNIHITSLSTLLHSCLYRLLTVRCYISLRTSCGISEIMEGYPHWLKLSITSHTFTLSWCYHAYPDTKFPYNSYDRRYRSKRALPKHYSLPAKVKFRCWFFFVLPPIFKQRCLNEYNEAAI